MDTIQDFTANSGNFRNLWATSFTQEEIRSYVAEVGVKVHDLFERHLLKHGRTFLISDDITIADFKVGAVLLSDLKSCKKARSPDGRP